MTPFTLDTPRLRIRAFIPQDAATILRIFDEAFGNEHVSDKEAALQEMTEWTHWSALNHVWFPKMGQAPYGDRAIVLKSDNSLIGSVGFVPLIDAFEQIPEITHTPSRYNIPEFGLFWVIDPAHQGKGYASESAQAMVDYAFKELRLKRIVATTAHANVASQTVMKKIGMTLYKNPLPEPHWLQVVGMLQNTTVQGEP